MIFLWFTMIFQSFSHKRKTNLHRGPQSFTKKDSSETVLLVTIYMSHRLCRQALLFLWILVRGPPCELNRGGHRGGQDFGRRRAGGGREWWGSARGSTRIHGTSWLSPRWFGHMRRWPLAVRHGRGGAPMTFGLGEHAREMEHDEAKAVMHVVGCEGAWRPGNGGGHGAPLLRHGERREQESKLEEGGASA